MSDERKYTLHEVIAMGTEIGIKAALDEIKRLKTERIKTRYDRRLRNTKLLLKNYRIFITYCQEAIFSKKNENAALSILEELDEYEGNSELFIESIKTSKERTLIIIRHIEKMLAIYRYIAEKSKNPAELRRYKTLKMIYLDENELTTEEIAKELIIDVRSVHRYKDDAIVFLGGLMFGVDGVKVSN